MKNQSISPIAAFLAILAVLGAGCDRKTSVESVESGPPTTVEVSFRTQGGDTARLSSAKVEVAESVSPPAGSGKLRILKAVKRFKGIVTDADGKAVLNGLKPGYFVVVSDERQIGEKKEERLWIVAASEARDGRLSLSAENLAPPETLEAPSETLETTWLLTPNTINAWNRGMKYWMWAITNGHKDTVEMLIANGADVNAKTDINWMPRDCTPLHVAVENGKKEIADLLLANGAGVNAQDGMQRTPLHYAISAGHKDIAELLLAKGADVNAKDIKGGSPLHFAAQKGDKGITELLLAKGAEVNARASASGVTPLGTAIHRHRDEVADLLRAHGAKE